MRESRWEARNSSRKWSRDWTASGSGEVGRGRWQQGKRGRSARVQFRREENSGVQAVPFSPRFRQYF